LRYAAPNKKLYNAGSEWQDDVEGMADYYSTFFREYDPVIGRFNGVDPMSESFESWTTYHYSYNNPVNFNDPTGSTQAPTGGGVNHYRPERGMDYWMAMENAIIWGDWEETGGGGGVGSYAYFKEHLDYWGSPEWRKENGIGGAWEIKNKWDSKFIKMFGNEFLGILQNFDNSGQKFTCDDLALQAVIAFSSIHNLPFVWETGSGTFDASDSKYNNVNEFLLDVKSHSGAPDFAKDANTMNIKFDDIKPGTLNVLTSQGKKNPNHIQMITAVFTNGKFIPMKDYQGITSFTAVQGNFREGWMWGRYTGSDNPNSWRYLGVSMQTGLYFVQANLWYNSTQNAVTLNFIGQHYSNQYRNFNFLNWNH
jgi:RHS repeat-associated protein